MQGVGAFGEMLSGLQDQGLSRYIHLNVAPKSLVFTEHLSELSLVWTVRTEDKCKFGLKVILQELGYANIRNMHWEHVGIWP